MPNTLIHLAVQGSASAGALRIAPRLRRETWAWDWPLILLGAVLPDLPWIVQRVLRTTLLRFGVASTPEGDPIFYDLRLFAGVQSSLAFCLLLAAACALVTRRPSRCFFVLGVGALLHLLLDATQIKWANGVLLLAPFDWRLFRFDWLWPEHALIPWLSLMSFCGVAALVWRISPPEERLLAWGSRHRRRRFAALLLLALYLLGPLALAGRLEASGAYSISALRSERVGEPVELGTAWVFESEEPSGGPTGPAILSMRTMSERWLRLDAGSPVALAPGRWSVRGELIERDGGIALHVTDAHLHPRRLREYSSILGLVIVSAVWLRFAARLRH